MSLSSAGARYPLSSSEIFTLGETLPAAPRIVAQLGEMLKDVDIDVAGIAQILRTDPALVMRIIRMSSTIMFGGPNEIVDIEQALDRVGFSSVLGLVGAAGITQLAPQPLRIYGIDIDTFQRGSLCHALAAENLAKETGEDPHAAYTAALLRGIGMIILDRAAGNLNELPEPFGGAPDQCYADYERTLFGVTSADVTRMLMDEWKFPEAIVAAIDQYYLATPDALGNRLACVVNVSGEMAAISGHGFPGDQQHWNAASGKYDVLGISLEFWNQLCAVANERFLEACTSLKVMN